VGRVIEKTVRGSAPPRTVVLASPRASCAGVERAIETVERTLAHYGPPVYVRRQIVHNTHVVTDLTRRGAVFVAEVDEVPRGATLVLAAHGVSPAVKAAARSRSLNVIDATCPLVNKVHGEARRFARAGRTIVLVGHEEHEEVEGTVGEAPDRIQVVSVPEDVAALEVEDPDNVAYLTQTTLAVDETAAVVGALRARFPTIVGPPAGDICYATQNRQDAVKAMAPECDVVLVIGSESSSNSHRLVEVAERHGARAWLIEDETAIDPGRLADARTIGVTAGASAPEALVRRVVNALREQGPIDVRALTVASEDHIRFKTAPLGRDRLPSSGRTAR
jgi:4-hydroxy-3-methylbut-2-en-1-yl diphosphate reductase